MKIISLILAFASCASAAGGYISDGLTLNRADGRYVDISGDVMTGPLTTSSFTVIGNAGIGGTLNVAGNSFSVGTTTFSVINGKVGIGITPDYTLDVADSIMAGPLTGSGRLIIGPHITQADSRAWSFRNDGAAFGDFDLYVSTSNNPRLNPTFTSVITFKSNGNIGINTVNPVTKLDVNGSFNTSGNITVTRNSPFVLLQNPNTTGFGGMYMINTTTAGVFLESTSAGQLYADSLAQSLILSNDGANPIQLRTNGATRQTILSNGNIGIGTTAPASMLDVNGTGHFAGTVKIGTTTGSAFVHIQTPAGTNSQNGYSLKISSGDTTSVFGIHPNGHFSIYGSSPTLGTCLNGGVVAGSGDTAGTILFTGANSSCAIVFGDSFDATPVCVLTGAVATASEGAIISANSASGITFVPNTGAWDTNDAVNYICLGTH